MIGRVPLPDDILKRIAVDFAPGDAGKVISLLEAVDGPETQRVLGSIKLCCSAHFVVSLYSRARKFKVVLIPERIVAGFGSSSNSWDRS